MLPLIKNIFLAGVDSSATPMVWVMTELARKPELMKKAQEEIRRNVEKKDEASEHQDCNAQDSPGFQAQYTTGGLLYKASESNLQYVTTTRSRDRWTERVVGGGCESPRIYAASTLTRTEQVF
ncbi:hypothetical protein Sjap_005518 [Stephania japonica]|uniref:Cytochrome P450 n=1 Tax=Stephania japonica TaxID=461633 RepID=A0AAP0PL76_9MAGN